MWRSVTKEIFPIIFGSLLEASAISCAIAEPKYRCPVDGSFDPMESGAVCALSENKPSEPSSVADCLHSDGPSHYALLECKHDGASWKHTYFDALKFHSENALKVAQQFVDNLLSGGVVAQSTVSSNLTVGVAVCGASTGLS